MEEILQFNVGLGEESKIERRQDGGCFKFCKDEKGEGVLKLGKMNKNWTP